MSSQSSQLSEPSFICISSTTGSISPSHSHLCIAAPFFLNQIFQRRSLAKISMLHRKMIWILNTSLHTNCGKNKYQKQHWVCSSSWWDRGGGSCNCYPTPNITTWISSVFILNSKHIQFNFWLWKQFLQLQMKYIKIHPSSCTPPCVLLTLSTPTLYNLLPFKDISGQWLKLEENHLTKLCCLKLSDN